MLARLDYDQENRKPEEIRRELDQELEVDLWQAPVTTVTTVRDDGTPSWWVSDEEASQGFLASVGVSL